MKGLGVTVHPDQVFRCGGVQGLRINTEVVDCRVSGAQLHLLKTSTPKSLQFYCKISDST